MYQSGKVGSKSVDVSLDAVGCRHSFSHSLNPRTRNSFINDITDDDAEFITSYCNRKIDKLKNQKHVKIITLVRDPIDRVFSRIFQFISYGINNIMSPGESYMDKCYAQFMIQTVDDNMQVNSYGDNQFSWFDNEIYSVFGIDVFAYPFNKEKGYTLIGKGNIEILIMKMEKLNMLEQTIADFVGAPDFKLINSNETSSKESKYLYKNTKDRIKIPKEFVSFYYHNNPRVDHFYSEEEKRTFLKKWEKMYAKNDAVA